MGSLYLNLLGLSAGVGFLQSFFPQPQGSQMAGFIGVAISFALALPQAIGDVMWSLSLMEQKMCSVQRIREITNTLDTAINASSNIHDGSDGLLFHERSQEVIRSINDLPSRAGVKLENVDVSYQQLTEISKGTDHSTGAALKTEKRGNRFAMEILPPSLIDITVEALPGEHIGIIGRTGSGKQE